jgi:hypothetical protein
MFKREKVGGSHPATGVENLVHNSQAHTPVPSVVAQKPITGKFKHVLKDVLLCLFCWFDIAMQNFSLLASNIFFTRFLVRVPLTYAVSHACLSTN